MSNIQSKMESRVSRRTLFKGAGALGAGMLLAQSGVSFGAFSAATRSGAMPNFLRTASAEEMVEDLQFILDATVTTEMFGVTILGHALESNRQGNYNPPFPPEVVAILEAARAQEVFHLEFFQNLGGRAITDTFTVPDPALLTDPVLFFQALSAQEARETAAQIAAFHTFTALNRPDLIKVSFQYAAEESEHRLLANYAAGVRPPNDHGFAPKLYDTVAEFVAELQALGFIGGDGIEIVFPGPGEIDASNVTNRTPDGPMVDCAAASMRPLPGSIALFAPLSGANEVPGPGDPDGFGFAKIIVNPQGQICFDLSVARIEPATAAHIHIGPPGVAGEVVVPLAPPTAEGFADGCLTVDPALARAILADPMNYYVNVHNAEYPAGAIRGNLHR